MVRQIAVVNMHFVSTGHQIQKVPR